LVASYGRSFEARNLRGMMQFAEQFLDFGIVSPLATQLSWTHVVEVLPLKTAEARLFYLVESATRQLGKRELRRMINRKAFERKEIANAQLTEASAIALDTFKDFHKTPATSWALWGRSTARRKPRGRDFRLRPVGLP
jgi:DUF1016 N-terminal domain